MNLFSNRALGATLLIAGCCIGAGMLGLPVVSSLSGFVPSTVVFTAVWFYMLVAGLILVEVNLSFREEVSFVSMAERTLGRWGKVAAATLFLVLFYSLMVAYITGSAVLVTDFVHTLFGKDIPNWAGGLGATVILGLILYAGTATVDHLNRILMVGLFASYLLLVGIGLPHVKLELLTYQDWTLFYVAIPVMVISFGYHNLVPTLTTYLGRQRRDIITAIVIGSVISLGVYFIWDGLIIGLVDTGLKEILKNGDLPTHALRTVSQNSWVGTVAEYFAFFALATSFLGVSLSIVDFLADGMRLQKTYGKRLLLTLLAVAPPYLFALVYPKAFFVALNYAGGICAVLLFGVIPVCMVWKTRYAQKTAGVPLVPGGKSVLILILVASLAIVMTQLALELGVIQ